MPRPAGRTTRGGINKRHGGPPRADREGDVPMGSAEHNGRRSGGRGSGRGPRANSRGLHQGLTRVPRPAKPALDPVTVTKLAHALGLEGSRPRGRGRGGLGKNGGRPRGGDALHHFAVTGFKQSKAATNEDGGVASLIQFLERKAAVTIKKSRQEGDSLIISVRPEDASQITKLHDYLFAGVNIRVARIEEPIALDSHAECDTPNTISTLKSVLDYRYTPDLRLLDLSDLGNDPLLKNIGIFDSQSRQSKFFPVLMTICDRLFDTAEAKVEAVTSVSLANNGLSTVGPVTTLAQTFPAIKNLDLSNNNLANLQGLDAWRWKFRSLEQLILSGNPLKVEAPNYVEEIIRWYPTLRTLDTIPVRSAEEAKPVSTTQLPLPIMVSSFRDEATVGENFIKEFFAAYDRDRTACINAFYDAKSTFSLSINTSAPRASNSQSTKAVGWDAVIKKSRNLIRVTQLPARLSRLYTGAQSISDAWATLPPSRHPDLLTEASKWCIECNAIPSLPDPVGQSVSGVGGLIIIVHGEFDEVNISTNETIITRSFDRTFILAPAGGVGGVRVACDTLILRSYGGSEAWKPQVGDFLVAHPAQPELLIQPLIPPGFGLAQPGKSDEQLQKECLAVELSKTTKMNLEFSGMCLQQSGWSLEAAAATFEAARPNIPPEAFVSL